MEKLVLAVLTAGAGTSGGIKTLTLLENLTPDQVSEIRKGIEALLEYNQWTRRYMDEDIPQATVSRSRGRSGKQSRIREIATVPMASSADRGWVINDIRQLKNGNIKNLRLPRNGRNSPGRGRQHRGYELAHPIDAPASRNNSYKGSRLKNAIHHRRETSFHFHRY